MNEQTKEPESKPTSFRIKWWRRETRPLTTDERAGYVILSLYMGIFCLCTFLYWDSLMLKIIGATCASAGLFLFVAAFFNTEAPEKSDSIHPLRSYLLNFFKVLVVILLLRYIGGLIKHSLTALVVIYSGLVVALIVFRKAMLQVIAAGIALVFLFVMIVNWNTILTGRMTFSQTLGHGGQAIFRIGPIQEVAAVLIAGNYIGYLNKIDYRDEQLNIVATRAVAAAGDDELRKTRALLRFVSNEIHYVSDPNDGIEYAKTPVNTLIAGGGDCEDKALLICSLLESVGLKTYIALTHDHVFALVQFEKRYPDLAAAPHVFIDGRPCYALDAADRNARIGQSSATPIQIRHVFDVRHKLPVKYSLSPEL